MSEYANAFRLALLTAAIYVAALTVGVRLLYYLAYVLAAVLLLSFVWSQVSKRGLRLTRTVEPAQAQVGQVVHETIELLNLSWLRKLWLEVRDHSSLPGHRVGAVVSLPGRGHKRWRVRTRCIHRGLYRLGPTAVLTGDPFGLFHTSRLFDDSSELLVYPATMPLASFGLPATELPGGSRTRGRAFHSTPSAAGIREYIPGDPMNRIHWPVSARAQQLMVKEFELDPTSDLWLVLDLQEDVHVELPGWRETQDNDPLTAHYTSLSGETGELALDPTSEEYAVAVSASLAAHFLAEGRSVGLIAWGQHKVTLPADRGGRQLSKILRALAVLRAEGETALAEMLTAESRLFGRKDTLVIVTPSLDEEWLGALQLQMYKGIRASVVVVEPNTFGGFGNPLILVSALTSMNVPSYLVKRDQAIDVSLQQQFGRGAARNLR